MVNIKNLTDQIENLDPIPWFDSCITNKACYRIGEFWSLAYDFDKFSRKLNKNFSEIEVLNYIYKNYNYKDNLFVKFIDEPTREKIATYDDKILFCDDLDGALVGVRFGFDENKNIAVYDYDKCVECIMSETDEEFTEIDAIEYMEFNITGSYVGEYTPCFLTDIDE
jgi:hypothetical protein